MRYAVTALFVCATAGAHAANSFLGFIETEGSFQLDQSKVRGSATLFEGSVVETSLSPCNVHLQDGSEIRIGAESRVRFFGGRAVIQKGALEIRTSALYRVQASAFRISTNPPETVAAVRLEGAAGVTASTAKGELLVATAEDAPVADVPPGKNVTLTPDDSATASLTKVTGCMQSAGKSVVLVDEASNLTFVIQGKGVESEIGNRVELIGASPSQRAKGGRRIIDVSRINVVGVCVAGAMTQKTAGAAAAKRVAVIGGVAVAGAVGYIKLANALAADQPASASRE